MRRLRRTRVEGNQSTGHLPHDGFIEALVLDNGHRIEGDSLSTARDQGVAVRGRVENGLRRLEPLASRKSRMGSSERTWSTLSLIPEQCRKWAGSGGYIADRAGNGLVYCNDFMDEETARDLLLDNVPEKTPLSHARYALQRAKESSTGIKTVSLLAYRVVSLSRWNPPVSISFRMALCGCYSCFPIFPSRKVRCASTTRKCDLKPSTLETLLFCITRSMSDMVTLLITVATWSCLTRLNIGWSCLNVQPESLSHKTMSLQKTPGCMS